VGTPSLATSPLISVVEEVVVIENNLRGLVRRNNLEEEEEAEEVTEEETVVVIGTIDKEVVVDIAEIEAIVVVDEEAEVDGVVIEAKVAAAAGVIEEIVDPHLRETIGGKRNLVIDTMAEVEEETLGVVAEDVRMIEETDVEEVEVVKGTAMTGPSLDQGMSALRRNCSTLDMDPPASTLTDTRIFQWR